MGLVDTDDEFAISYQGVTLGVPVLTRDGEQFGILEHVLDVPEEDIFEGIVVWVGGGTWADRQIQRELSRGHQPAARHLEALRPHHLRFVQADTIAAITVSYIRCDLDRSQADLLQPPSGTPVFHASDFDRGWPGRQVYWNMFGTRRGIPGYGPYPPPGGWPGP
jgi:hypothetical protein